MTISSDARNPVELLAEEFLDRKRRGEQPTLREYLDRHPELAAEIRDLFPALLMMEDLGESSGGTTGSLAADGAVAGVRLQRLGDYRILREIGRGGMGVVYEAEQESLGRRVALKVLSAGSLLDPKQVRRFERESKAAARLHHTNIVPVFGVGRQDGHHYFVMQFIAGVGLDVVLDDLRRLRQAKSEARPAVVPASVSSRIAGLSADAVARSLMTGRFAADAPPANGSVTEPFDPAANGPPPDLGSSPGILPGSSELSASSDRDRQFYRSVARIGVQVAEALEYANRQGILHRDVKPSNLLLDNHGNVWVADFGLAKTAEADDLTHTGDILGTIRYMAPERFSGQCDARSDVYSLGLTLYELVALRPAYEASDRHTLIDRVLHEDPERLKRLAPVCRGTWKRSSPRRRRGTLRDDIRRRRRWRRTCVGSWRTYRSVRGGCHPWNDWRGGVGGTSGSPRRLAWPWWGWWLRSSPLCSTPVSKPAWLPPRSSMPTSRADAPTSRRRRPTRSRVWPVISSGEARLSSRLSPSRTAGWPCCISSAAGPPLRKVMSASGCSGLSSRCGRRSPQGTRLASASPRPTCRPGGASSSS